LDVPHLRRLRQQAVLSQQQLAQSSGVARDTVSKLETGQRQAYPKTIQSLARSLGVEPRELVEGHGEVGERAEGDLPEQRKGTEGAGSKKKAGF